MHSIHTQHPYTHTQTKYHLQSGLPCVLSGGRNADSARVCLTPTTHKRITVDVRVHCAPKATQYLDTYTARRRRSTTLKPQHRTHSFGRNRRITWVHKMPSMDVNDDDYVADL